MQIKSKFLILGASGLIGYNFFLYYFKKKNIECYGSVRSILKKKKFKNKYKNNIIILKNLNSIKKVINKLKPNVVMNCIGITKHVDKNLSLKKILKINYILPKNLAKFCKVHKIKFVHLSSDCVYSGIKEKNYFYSENSKKDAVDRYGLSKSRSEMLVKPAIVVRTSTVGIEKFSNYGLFNWFKNKKNVCDGFYNAYFTGLPTIVLAEMIYLLLLKAPHYSGLINIAGPRISKYLFLKKVKKSLKKNITILKKGKPILDRSLSSKKFEKLTNVAIQSKFSWNLLIKKMLSFNYD